MATNTAHGGRVVQFAAPTKQVRLAYPLRLLVCEICDGTGTETWAESCDFCDVYDGGCPFCDGWCQVDRWDTCGGCAGEGRTEPPRGFDDLAWLLIPAFERIAGAGIGVTVPDGSEGRTGDLVCMYANASLGDRGGWVGVSNKALAAAARGEALHIAHLLPDLLDQQTVLAALSTVGCVLWDCSIDGDLRVAWKPSRGPSAQGTLPLAAG